MPKKKFKDTKVGQFILKKIPGFAADLLPENGILGIVKNLIDNEPNITPQARAEMHKELVEMYELEIRDRESARLREVEVKKTGSQDWMMFITGIVGLVSFLFVIYAVVYEPSIKENDLFVHLMGMIEGVVISNIFAYYYGTSVKNKK